MALLWPYSTAFELKHLLRQSAVTRLFVAPDLFTAALSAAYECGVPREHIYILGGKVDGQTSFDAMIDDITRANVPQLPVQPAQKDTLAYMIFSSGTTGLPKAVMISHGSLSFTCAQIKVKDFKGVKDVFTQTGTTAALAFMPLSHAYGNFMVTMRGIIAPVTQIIMPRWDLDQALDALVKHRIQWLPLNTAIMQELIESRKARETDLSFVTTIVSGGTYLSLYIKDKMKEVIGHSVNFTGGYGASELLVGGIGFPHPGVLPHVKLPADCTGILWPGMEARVLRADGSDANANEIGDLYLRGPNIAMGYRGNQEATKVAFLEDGWFKTGDVFTVDENGAFYFKERVKDTLNVSGRQVSPTEIENTLLVNPRKLIIDVCIAGVFVKSRDAKERVPRAWVVLSNDGHAAGGAAVATELNGWIQGKLGQHKWLTGGIEIVDKIPKSHTGKPLRRVLQQRYETGM